MGTTNSKITILGMSLSLKSNEESQQLQDVINYFKFKINETQKKLPTADPLKVALIAGLNLADELLKERNKSEKELQTADLEQTKEAQEIEKTTNRILSIIDQIL